MNAFQLRDYQLKCSDSILREWDNHQSTLLCLYTGGGKTIIFSDVIRRKGGRALVLANTEELVFQNFDKIRRSTGLKCVIEMGAISSSYLQFNSADVVVATVQTMIAGKEKKRMHRLNPGDLSCVIVDEAHMSVSPSWKKTLDFVLSGGAKLAGFTATPDRHDKKALGVRYETVAENIGILDGRQDGWLCEITQQFISVKSLDYSHIKTYQGDLKLDELQRELERQENVAGICQPSLEVMFGLAPKTLTNIPVPEWGGYIKSLNREARRTIVFTASVEQARMCAEIFNRAVPGLSDYVCGDTNKQNRRDLLKAFANGSVRAIMNCAVLTHGFDDPGVEVIIMARPTKSRSLYAQMVGRSTRPLPGIVDGPDMDTPEKRIAAIAASPKPFCRIVDFTPNSSNHRLVTSPDILGGRVSDEAVQEAIKKGIEDGKPFMVCKRLEQQEQELEAKRIKLAQLKRAMEESKRAHLVPKSDFTTQELSVFDKYKVRFQPATDWDRGKGRVFSPAQRWTLKVRIKVNPDKISYSCGLKLIGEYFKRNPKPKKLFVKEPEPQLTHQ